MPARLSPGACGGDPVQRAADAVVVLSDDGQHFTLTQGAWSGTYPLEDLPGWRRFYQRLHDRKAGSYAAFYALTLAALDAFARSHADY